MDTTNVRVYGDPIKGKLSRILIDSENMKTKCDSALGHIIAREENGALRSKYIEDKIKMLCEVNR